MAIKIPVTLYFRPFEFTKDWLKDWHQKFEQTYETISRYLNNTALIYNRTIYFPTTFTAGQEVFAEIVSDDMYIDVNFGKSQGRSGVMAAATQSVFVVKRNGSQIGTITHNVGSSPPVYATSAAAQIKFARGDDFSITAPNPVDASLARVCWVIQSIRL